MIDTRIRARRLHDLDEKQQQAQAHENVGEGHRPSCRRKSCDRKMATHQDPTLPCRRSGQRGEIVNESAEKPAAAKYSTSHKSLQLSMKSPLNPRYLRLKPNPGRTAATIAAHPSRAKVDEPRGYFVAGGSVAAGRGFFSIYEVQVAGVHNQAKSLAGDENRILLIYGVNEQNRRPPPTLKYQNATGTTLRPAFSLAHHCTTKRDMKSA